MEKRFLISTVLLLVVACGDKSEAPDRPPAPLASGRLSRLVIAAGDYLSKGTVAVVDLVAGEVRKDLIPTHTDTVLRAPAGSHWIYVVNRLGADNIQKVAKNGGSRFPECKVGALSNPQDVAESSAPWVYVSRLGKVKELLLLNPDTCASEPGPSLEALADADGFPEMGHMHRTQNRLLIQVRRLDSNDPMLAPQGNGIIAVVDLATRAVSKIDLQRPNPTTDFKTGPEGSIYVGATGRMGNRTDGAIERLDLRGLRSVGPILEESTAGGDIYDFEIVRPDLGMAIVLTGPKDKLITFDPSTGAVGTVLLEAQGYTLAQLLLDRERNVIYLAHRDRHRPGVRIFDADTLREKTETFFDVGRPPVWMELTE